MSGLELRERIDSRRGIDPVKYRGQRGYYPTPVLPVNPLQFDVVAEKRRISNISVPTRLTDSEMRMIRRELRRKQELELLAELQRA